MPTKKGPDGMRDCMAEFKAGSLHSGASGPVVTKHSQAIAICLSKSGQSRQQTQAKGSKR